MDLGRRYNPGYWEWGVGPTKWGLRELLSASHAGMNLVCRCRQASEEPEGVTCSQIVIGKIESDAWSLQWSLRELLSASHTGKNFVCRCRQALAESEGVTLSHCYPGKWEWGVIPPMGSERASFNVPCWYKFCLPMQTGIGRTRGCNRRKGFERSGQDLWQNWQKYLNISNPILINKSMFTIEIIRIGYWAAILLAIAFKSFSLCWSWHAIVSQIVYYSSVRTNLRRHVRTPSVTLCWLLVTLGVRRSRRIVTLGARGAEVYSDCLSNWAINSKVEVFSCELLKLDWLQILDWQCQFINK